MGDRDSMRLVTQLRRSPGVSPAAGVERPRFGAGRGQHVRASVKSAHAQLPFVIDGPVGDVTQHSSENKNYNCWRLRR